MKAKNPNLQILKKKSHEDFDSLTDLSGYSFSARQKFKTIEYKLWAAVLLGEPLDITKNNGKKFCTEGILDGFKGDNHFTKLPLHYHQFVPLFTSTLREIYRGKINKISNSLLCWESELNKEIKDLPHNQKDEAIIEFIEQSELVQIIRQRIGLAPEPEVKTEEVPEVTIKIAETPQKNTENNAADSSDEEFKDSPNRKIPNKFNFPKTNSATKPKRARGGKNKKSKSEKKSEKINLPEISEEEKDNLFNAAQSAEFLGNIEEAKKLYKEAEEKSYPNSNYDKPDAEAQCEIDQRENTRFYDAYHFYHQHDIDEARSFMIRMAKKGNCAAQNCLAVDYLTRGKEEKAFEYFEAAAKKGHYLAQYNLSTRYLKVDNFHEAFKYCALAADQGMDQAQFNLSAHYEHGVGCDKNMDLAFYFCEKASAKDHTQAQYNLGLFHLKGISCPQNSFEAFKYFKLAADKNHVKSIYNVGYAYSIGVGCEKDKITAVKYFKLAAQKDDAKALKEILPTSSQAREEFDNSINSLKEICSLEKIDAEQLKEISQLSRKCYKYISIVNSLFSDKSTSAIDIMLQFLKPTPEETKILAQSTKLITAIRLAAIDENLSESKESDKTPSKIPNPESASALDNNNSKTK